MVLNGIRCAVAAKGRENGGVALTYLASSTNAFRESRPASVKAKLSLARRVTAGSAEVMR